MVRTQIQMTEEQISRLKELASSEHKSMAEMIRNAVDEYVSRKPALTTEEMKEKAISAAGRFRSKSQDLSGSHDRYLLEVYRK